MPKYKVVIFDFDDTLVESRVQKWAHHTHVAKKFYNIDLTEETLREHWGKPLDKLISNLYQDSDTIENMMDVLTSTRKDFTKKEIKGSMKVIDKLLSSDMSVGILSATTKLYLVEELESFNFPLDRFSIIQGADETLFHKPHPDVFLPVIKKFKELGIRPDEIVYVGDSIDDWKASSGAGLGFIGVTTGLYTKEDFESMGVREIVGNIEDTLSLILE